MSYRKNDYLLAVILTVFLISLAVVVAVFEPFIFRIDLELYHLASRAGLAKDVVLANYDSLIDYQSLFHTGELVLPDFAMSSSGRIHFREVKDIFVIIQLATIVTGLASMTGVVWRLRCREYRFLNLTSYLVVIIPSMIGIVAIGNFDRAFIFFHQLVFNNDYWIFDATADPVIEILPEELFFHKFVLIIVLIFVFATLLKVAYRKFQAKIIRESLVSNNKKTSTTKA
ncbi:MAG: TIGR01906 family membrane protein [Erysipelotrichaceae bacterium]|nr:TIGR01906 family membrane protein [Erysipelotrichaceae bacterium]